MSSRRQRSADWQGGRSRMNQGRNAFLWSTITEEPHGTTCAPIVRNSGRQVPCTRPANGRGARARNKSRVFAPPIIGKTTTAPSTRTTRQQAAFTLIEVLVVVAIIALLIAVMLPSLSRAREQSRAVVCMSNLKQQGLGLSGYSPDNRGVLPWGGAYRYTLLEGDYYVGMGTRGVMPSWAVVNTGLLYPRHIGSTPDLYYCPNNKGVEATGPNGKAVFVSRFRNQRPTDPRYHNAHDLPGHPYSSYCYALPVATAKSPRDAGRDTYPEQSVRYGRQPDSSDHPYWAYLTSPTDPVPGFLKPSAQATRGRHTIHALLSDMYFAGFNEVDLGLFEGYHLKSYNVLFSDFHAKRVVDPEGQIHAAGLQPILAGHNAGVDLNGFKVYKVWDHFSSNP